MGTDIYMRAEVRRDSEWRAVGEVFDNPWYDAEKPVSASNRPKTAVPYDTRIYTLFAFLADVRNGQGDVDWDAGNPIVPISMPRGAPRDASEEYLEECDRGYSHSWLLLSELDAADWDQPVTLRDHLDADPRLGTQTVRDLCSDFVERVMPALHELGEPDSVRIVFCFDG